MDGTISLLIARLGKEHRTLAGELLGDLGLHAGQEMLLSILWGEEPLGPGAIASRLGVAAPTVTKMLRRLEEQGLVERTIDPNDARAVLVRTTEAGMALKSAVEEVWNDLEAITTAGLSEEDGKNAAHLLETIRGRLAKPRIRIAVIGAAGRLGARVVLRALAAGHRVTAVSRSIESDRFRGRRVRIIRGDARKTEVLSETLEACDAVISCAGHDAYDRPTTQVSEVAVAVLEAAPVRGIRRVILVAAAGVLPGPRGGYLGEERLPPGLEHVFRDHVRQYEAVRDSDLDWTVLCPPAIAEGAETGAYTVEAEALPPGPFSIGAEDLAAFLVEETIARRFVKTRVGICSKAGGSERT